MISKPERRLISLRVGIGATGLGMLFKLTAILALPGWLVASLVERFTSGAGAFWLAVYIANFIFWTGGTYLFLAWRRRQHVAV